MILYNAYDRGQFGLDELTEEEDAVYLRYLVARLAAYRNVWWSLCNEFDQLERPADRWDRMARARRDRPVRSPPLDPQRDELYDHNKPWVTHASIQNGSATTDFGRAILYRDVYRKPIVFDEIKYEGDIPERWGNLSAPRRWCTGSGSPRSPARYAATARASLTASGQPPMVEGGPLRGESPRAAGVPPPLLEEARRAGARSDRQVGRPGLCRRHPAAAVRAVPRPVGAGDVDFRLPIGFPGERPEPGDTLRR